MSKTKKDFCIEDLEQKLVPPSKEWKTRLSLIMPVYNCSERIGISLESVLKQHYPHLEVIVIDAGSTDHTLESLSGYAPLINRIYSVSEYHLADMLNRGISLATGEYITFLFPGCYYLSNFVFDSFAAHIDGQQPDVIYCGSIQRELKRPSRIIFFPFDRLHLEKGKQPTLLPAVWFKADVFEKIGKFDTHKMQRESFDFFCRLILEKEVKAVLIDRVFVDFDYGAFRYGKIIRYAIETCGIISKHFGFSKAVAWFLTTNHLLLAKGLWRHLKQLLFQK